MADQPKLGERELDILNALWERGEASVTEVLEDLKVRGHEVAYNTVQTMLNRLESKGHAARELRGRAYVYRARLRRPAAAGKAVRTVIERFFGGSSEALAAHLVTGDLDPAELDRVSLLIKEARKKEGKR